jgi:hypothetical protein
MNAAKAQQAFALEAHRNCKERKCFSLTSARREQLAQTLDGIFVVAFLKQVRDAVVDDVGWQLKERQILRESQEVRSTNTSGQHDGMGAEIQVNSKDHMKRGQNEG